MLADKQWGFINYADKELSKTHLYLLLIGWAISVIDLICKKRFKEKSHKITGKIPLLLQILGFKGEFLEWKNEGNSSRSQEYKQDETWPYKGCGVKSVNHPFNIATLILYRFTNNAPFSKICHRYWIKSI